MVEKNRHYLAINHKFPSLRQIFIEQLNQGVQADPSLPIYYYFFGPNLQLPVAFLVELILPNPGERLSSREFFGPRNAESVRNDRRDDPRGGGARAGYRSARR